MADLDSSPPIATPLNRFTEPELSVKKRVRLYELLNLRVVVKYGFDDFSASLDRGMDYFRSRLDAGSYEPAFGTAH